MRQKISYALILSPLVVAILFLVVPSLKNFSYEPAYRDDGQLMPSDIRPDKLIFLLQYIGKDYGGAVENKKVVNPFEYQEMNDFTLTALEWYSRLRPEGADESIQQKLQRLKSLVENKADWSDVKALTSPLIRDLSQELHVFSFPLKTPDLKKGQDFYNIACADCHGVSGKGRGPAASWQSPLPSNFNDSARMNEATPHQFYNAITFGVAGTAMPSHQIAFTDQERWDIAFYLMTLRDGFHPQPPGRDFGFSMNDLAVTSNENLLARIRAQNHASGEDPESLQIVDHLRQNPPQVSPDEQLAYTRQKLNESFEAYDNANPSVAMESIMDAYLSGIEPLEPMLTQKRSSLVAAIEADFSKLRSAVRANQPVPVVAEYHQSLNRTLEEVGSELASSTAQKGFAWLQSFTIILREGIEAILLIALMITYLVSIGYQTLKKYVVAGALAGLAVGGLTWLAANSIFKITTLQREAMEGLTSLLAAAVLFSVSFWIIHKIDIQKWKSFIRTKAEKALGTGSGLALAAAAFLAVFREAFETVLFYQVLWLKNDNEQTSIVFGFVVGAVALTLVLVLIFKMGIRLPIKPFFATTGVLLGLLAFVFAGYGVRELQNIGWLKETLLPAAIRWNLLEIHPTLEGVALQMGILTSFMLGWFSVLAEKLKMARKLELTPVAIERNRYEGNVPLRSK